ncbi:MAG: putative bifunctional diguanylate cyclase/phosphodiesterase [Chromatiales bacterium]
MFESYPLGLACLCLALASLATFLLQRIRRLAYARDVIAARHRALMDQSGEGVFIVDARTQRILDANPAFCRLLGFRTEEIRSLSFKDVVGRHRPSTDRYIERLLKEQTPIASEGRYRRADGVWLGVDFTISPVEEMDGDVLCVTFRDISERKRAQDRIRRLTHFDHVTSLPNKLLMHDRLEQSLARAQRQGSMVAVIFVDLDRFKLINESLGHQAGDQLLHAVGRRLRKTLRDVDIVARQGGDEFIIVVSDIKQSGDTVRVADKLIEAFSTSFDINGHDMSVTCSVGISLYPAHASDIATLLKYADMAMYAAKELGGNGYQLFDASMGVRGLKRMAIETGLRRALNQREFRLVYEAQADIASGRIVGVEALLRWQHPQLGVLLPGEFIPIAEDSGLIVGLGDWVLREACEQARQWQRQGLAPLRIAVNLSPRQFLERDLIVTIGRVLNETGLPPRYLAIEITEGLLMKGMSEVVPTLHQLKLMGVSISIDDFGTGYSSLAYLQRIPIDAVKIDRSFVRGVCSQPGDAAIAKAVIALAHSLGRGVIAEGVETAEQMEFLRLHGCDAVQGHYISRPLDAEDFARLLRAGGRVSAGGG